MRNIFKQNIKIRISLIVLIALIISSILVFTWYQKVNDTKVLTILGSLFAGMIVAIIQFLIAWQDYLSIEKLKDLQINKVLLDRDNRDFYENYVKSAKKNLDVMGVTGSRFMEDFANNDEDALANSKVLLQVMANGVKVRILMPNKEYLFSDKEIRNEVNARERYLRISEIFSNNFEVRYFSHIPAHSIFIIDDECIVGPVFEGVPSKHTPALYMKSKSPFADKYIKYFNDEWIKATPI